MASWASSVTHYFSSHLYYMSHILRRHSLEFPPIAGKRERKLEKETRLKNNHSHTKLAQKNCEVSLSLRLTINDLLPNRKWMWQERGSLVFTDIFVGTLSERRTNLCLLPHNRSHGSSSMRHGRWMGGRPTLLFLLHFFLHYLLQVNLFMYMEGVYN